MKKIFAVFALLCVMCTSLIFFGCASDDGAKNSVVCTTFAAYDFASCISGGKVQVVMLIPAGSEAHDFEPSARDIKTVASSSLFICNGGESEAWVERILSSTGGVRTLSLMDCCKDPLYLDGKDGREVDEHVWTSPKNAVLIAGEIYNCLAQIYPEYKDDLENNFNKLIGSLGELDAMFTELGAKLSGKTVIIGDRNPFGYIARDYGIEILAAFHGCGHDSEPSAAELKNLIDTARKQNTTKVFYVDFSGGKIARTVADELGNAEVLHLSSCHNVTASEFGKKSYIDLMTENIDNLLGVCDAAD